MGVSNPVEAVTGILIVLDEVRAKMAGTKIGEMPWTPATPDQADELVALVTEALQRCDDYTDALVTVAVAATAVIRSEAFVKAHEKGGNP